MATIVNPQRDYIQGVRNNDNHTNTQREDIRMTDFLNRIRGQENIGDGQLNTTVDLRPNSSNHRNRGRNGGINKKRKKTRRNKKGHKKRSRKLRRTNKKRRRQVKKRRVSRKSRR